MNIIIKGLSQNMLYLQKNNPFLKHKNQIAGKFLYKFRKIFFFSNLIYFKNMITKVSIILDIPTYETKVDRILICVI